MQGLVVSGISHRFRWLSQSEGQIAHVLLTRSPLVYPRKGLTARLACVKHAASVRPEPGSNSPLKTKDNHHNHKTRPQRIINTSRRIPAKQHPKTEAPSYLKESKQPTNTHNPPKNRGHGSLPTGV